MCITICGRFRLNEGGVVGYGNRMKAKYTVNWGVQIAGMIFQTRSKAHFYRLQGEEGSVYFSPTNQLKKFGDGDRRNRNSGLLL